MKTTVGATRIEVVSAGLLAVSVDAIIAVATTTLMMDHGVAAEIKAAAGEIVEREAKAQGPIEAGDAVATTAGSLPAKWVVHAAIEGGSAVDANLVAQATRRAFEVAERLRVRSVAVPLLTAEDSPLDVYACAGIMVGTVRRYLEGRPHTGLRRVLFSAPDAVTRVALNNAIAGSTRV
jgi:O-acetyl-ADP-ribose deacetylase (regulator of RNase III)